MLIDIARELTENHQIFDAEGICPTQLEPGNARLLIISGENAGGKSLFARALASRLSNQKPQVEAILISMNLRITPDMRRAFIFGEDRSSSTGNVSARTALTGLSTSRGRSNQHALLYDEPDIPAHFC